MQIQSRQAMTAGLLIMQYQHHVGIFSCDEYQVRGPKNPSKILYVTLKHRLHRSRFWSVTWPFGATETTQVYSSQAFVLAPGLETRKAGELKREACFRACWVLSKTFERNVEVEVFLFSWAPRQPSFATDGNFATEAWDKLQQVLTSQIFQHVASGNPKICIRKCTSCFFFVV